MNIELAYRERIAALSVVERVRRAEVLFNWSRDYVVRSIVATRGELSDSDLKYEVALRHYGTDRAINQLIEELRNRASR